MKKSLITAIALAFAAVSFAAQTPAKPAASNSTNSTKVKKHHSTTKKSTKSAAKSTSAPAK